MERTPHLQWAAQPPLEAPPQIASQQISQPLSGQHSLAPVSGDGPLASLESQASSPGLTGFSSDPRGFALISSADGSFHSGVSSQLGVGALQPGPLVGECAAASASQSWGEDRRHPPQPASFRAGAKIASSCSVDGVETAAGGRGPCLAAQSRSGGGGGERRSVGEFVGKMKGAVAGAFLRFLHLHGLQSAGAGVVQMRPRPRRKKAAPLRAQAKTAAQRPPPTTPAARPPWFRCCIA